MRAYKTLLTSSFINQLKIGCEVKMYNGKRCVFRNGYLLSKKNMRILCSHFYGLTYDNLSSGDKNLFIDKIFKKLESLL